MKTLVVFDREYEYFYSSEDGDFYTPKRVVHGAEPWAKVANDGTLYFLFNGRFDKHNGEYTIREE